MTEKDLPALNSALDKLYEAIKILFDVDGTLEITDTLLSGTNAIARRVVELEGD